MDYVAMLEQALAVLGGIHPTRHRYRLIGILDMQVDTVDLADALLRERHAEAAASGNPPTDDMRDGYIDDRSALRADLDLRGRARMI
jgi:hypothetical protein